MVGAILALGGEALSEDKRKMLRRELKRTYRLAHELFDEGREEGRMEGRFEERRNLAMKMIMDGIPI